jgi:hypothetical protein
MSRQVVNSSDPPTTPENPAQTAAALSEQQRTWVREIAETIKLRRLESRLRRHPKQSIAFGAENLPSIGGEIR